MNIVIAPDSFKESMTAAECASAIERGILRVSTEHNIIKVPMADGGEGTVDSLVDALNGHIITHHVTGPLGEKIEAFYGIIHEKTAVIEMAAASGLDLIPVKKRNPMKTTTYGTGELILHALDKGIRHFIIGIGGSATNDGGIGMAQALGVTIHDEHGMPVGYGGEGLANVADIKVSTIDDRIKDCRFEVACDVTNPLVGPDGATYIYGPQKGASEAILKDLDQEMKSYGEYLENVLGKEILTMKGGGAAGGLGAALYAFLDAKMKPGFDVVMELTELSSIIKDANLVFTGEGKIDDQTIYGKAPIGVAKVAKRFQVPVIALGGTVAVTTNELYEHGIDAVFSIANGPVSLEEAMEHAEYLTEKLVENLFRYWMIK